MKKRTINYFRKQKALQHMIHFRDISSFLMAGFILSKSQVVKRDILEVLTTIQQQKLQPIPVVNRY